MSAGGAGRSRDIGIEATHMRVYLSREALAEGVAEALADDLRAVLAKRGRAVLALPGGTTPAPAMAALARYALNWSRVTVLPGDERQVPQDHPRSNAGLIRRHLLVGPGAAARLVRLAPGAPAVDVLLLGMGEDGHVASLFPGAPGLDAALAPGAPEVVPMTAPDGEARLSLSLRALNAAGRRHLMITGAEKRGIWEGRQPPLPAALLAPGVTVHWAE